VRLAELEIRTRGPIVHATVRGEIDTSNAAEIRAEISTRTSNDAVGVVLDLREVTYLDSAGIPLIHHLREDLRAAGQRLQLVIPSDSIINATLKLAGLDWSDDTVGTLDAAEGAILSVGGG
jgi:anti-sigma B factor antagonist